MSHPSSTPDPHVSAPEPGNAPGAPSCDTSPPAKSWVWLAIVAGHFGAAVYVLLGVLSLVAFGSAVTDIPQDNFAARWPPVAFGVLAALFFAFALITEVVTIGLHRRRKWAWFAALSLFGLWLLSAIFPIGGMGMWGLLMRGSRREFGMS